MVDFSIFFLFLKQASEYIGHLGITVDLHLLMAVLAVLALTFYITERFISPKETGETSKAKDFFAKLYRFSVLGLMLSAAIEFWPKATSAFAAAMDVPEQSFSMLSIGALITMLCVGMFIASRFFPNDPNNNSLCNTRQVLTWSSYCSMIFLAFYMVYCLNFVVFRSTIVVIFSIMEIFSVIFWFYDPFIYIISQFFQKNRRVPCEPTPNKLNRFAVIGCAHNEEAVIGQLIKSLYATVYPKNKYDIYIICDNCSDGTADVVRRAGAIAMERNDLERRGKGYGLEWMFAHLERMSKEGNEYDAYIVLDADNVVNEEYLYAINEKVNEGHEILQTYLGCKNPGDTWISGSYSYSYWVSNTVYQMAHSKVGLSAQMGGTGMIIRPSVLRDIGWETDSLTEDLVLTARYVLKKNLPCCWIHDAKLYDEKPLELIPSIRQRTRWMQGHMAAMFKFAPKLFWSGIKHFSLKQIDIAFYLARPFLTVLMFVGYLARIYFNLFMAETMSVGFAMSENTSMVLLVAYFTLQFYVLFSERYGRYAPLAILQMVFSVTWYPAIFRGLIKRNERYWVSTAHTRNIAIEDVDEDVKLLEAKERLKGLDNIHKLPIGQILLKATAISKKQLDAALEYQQKNGGKLGDVIVEMSILSKDMLAAYLQIQQEEKDAIERDGGETYQRVRLGDMLVESGLITKFQLEAALEKQKRTGGLLGECLISTRCITSELMGVFLEVQKLLDANFISPKRTRLLIEGILVNHDKNLGTILWNGGLLSRQQLDYALEQQKVRNEQIGRILLECGFVSEDTLESILHLQECGRAHLAKMSTELPPEELPEIAKMLRDEIASEASQSQDSPPGADSQPETEVLNGN